MKNSNFHNGKNHSVITGADISHYPKELRETYQYLKEHQGEIHFPKKYFKGLRTVIKETIKKNPDFNAKKLLIHILEGVVENPSTDHLVAIAKMVKEEWEEFQKVELVMA